MTSAVTDQFEAVPTPACEIGLCYSPRPASCIRSTLGFFNRRTDLGSAGRDFYPG